MKFVNLLKKELVELINKQMLLGLVITFGILFLVGQVTTEVIEDVQSSVYNVNIIDEDDTEFTKDIISQLKTMQGSEDEDGIKLNVISKADLKGDDYSAVLDKNKIDSLIIIPSGFSKTILEDNKTAELKSISRMKSASALGTVSSDTSGGIGLINDCIKVKIMNEKGIAADDIPVIDSPVSVSETTVVDGKQSKISVGSIVGNMMTQNMIIPIIVFVLVVFTSQMIVNAISTEKIDKTLETLLSAPVSRTSILSSKMLAASIVALLNAVVYMVGFSSFIDGATSTVSEGAVDAALSVNEAMKQLGLTLSAGDYVLIGVQMFLTIMISLSISIILGAMVSDAKSAQTIIMPIMFCAMVPYMISMAADVNTLPTAIKTLVYAIPFTHTFTAMNNLMFGNYDIFYIGVGYQAVLFIICMICAVKLFNSDKILTSSLNFGQKSKFNKSKKTASEE